MVVPAVERYNSIVFSLIWLSSVNIILVVLFGAVPVDSKVEQKEVPLSTTHSLDKERRTVDPMTSSGIHSESTPLSPSDPGLSTTVSIQERDGPLIFNPH